MSEKRKDSNGRILRTGESQRKDGSYQYRYTNSAGKRVVVYHPTLKGLRDKEKEIEKGKFAGVDYTLGNLTLVDLLNKYLKLKSNLSANSITSYKAYIKLVERQCDFCRVPLNKIKPSDLKEFYVSLYNNGYSSESIKVLHGLIKPAFAMAYDDQILMTNPCMFKMNFLKGNVHEKKALTAEQQRNLLETISASRTYNKYYDLVVLMLNTGLRIGEVLGLTTKDIDFINHALSVNRQQLRILEPYTIKIGSPKTKAGVRKIPMIPVVEESLKNILNRRPPNADDFVIDGCSGFLFFTNNGTVAKYVNLQTKFKAMEKLYNKRYPEAPIRLTAHILRHTFCTNLMESGMSASYVQYLMGHSDAATTLQVYTHTNYDAIAKIAYRQMEQHSVSLNITPPGTPNYTPL